MAQTMQKGSWVPTEYRARVSRDKAFLQLIIEGCIYSVKVDLLMELLTGARESLRLFRLENHE